MKVNPLHSYITVWLEKIGIKKPDKPCIMTGEQKKMNMMLIDEEIQELMLALSKNNDIIELCDAYFDVLWVVTQSAMLNGLNINDIVRAGSLSNLSKFCDTEEEALATVSAYSNGTHPNKLGKYIDTHIEKVGDSFIIKRTKDDKVLKSINFKEPNFSFIKDRMHKIKSI
jgi:hypothetical protein